MDERKTATQLINETMAKIQIDAPLEEKKIQAKKEFKKRPEVKINRPFSMLAGFKIKGG